MRAQQVRYVEDLAPLANLDAVEYPRQHYAVERLLMLLVETSCDALAHLLAERGVARPDSYREVFLDAGRRGLVPNALARELALFAGLRNILAHRYADVQDEKVRAAVPEALATYREFAKALAGLAGVGG